MSHIPYFDDIPEAGALEALVADHVDKLLEIDQLYSEAATRLGFDLNEYLDMVDARITSKLIEGEYV